MGIYEKAIACGIVVFNVLGVVLGYGGLYKLKALRIPPFSKENIDASYLNWLFVARVPDWILYFWNSNAGSIVLWFGCLVLPIVLLALIFFKEKKVVGWSGLAISAIWLGFIGCWIFLYTILNAG